MFSEPEYCWRPDHVRQDIGEQHPAHNLATVLGIIGGIAGRDGGSYEVSNVLAIGFEVLGWMPGVWLCELLGCEAGERGKHKEPDHLLKLAKNACAGRAHTRLL